MNPELPRTVLLDASFILSLTRDRRDFYQEVRDAVGRTTFATTDGVIMELQRLARSGRFPSKGLAAIALSRIEEIEVEIRETLPSTPNVDTGIILVALGSKGPVNVATIDFQLRRTLTKLNVSTIGPRRKPRVERRS